MGQRVAIEDLPKRKKEIPFARKVLIGCGVIVLFLGAGGGGTVWHFSRQLPSLDSLREYQPSLVTRVYSNDHRLMGQFYVEKRILVPLSQMPKELYQSVLAVEDSRFYEHKGVDPLGIIRAFLTNLEALKIKQGASTITQQLARTLFLTSEKTLTRKIREALLAGRMEKILSKDEILELYLNQIYFGHGAYGVQAASRLYFGKDVGDLTRAEMAFLAGLPKAPHDYSPYNYPEKAKQRQGSVLRRMVEQGYITEREFQKAYQEDLQFQPLSKEEDIAPYFLEFVRQYLIATYGEAAVYRGGLQVYTTLSLDMQKAATRSLQQGLRDLDKRQGYRGPLFQRSFQEMAEQAGLLQVSEVHGGEILEGVVTKVEQDHAEASALGLRGRILLEDMSWAGKRLVGRDLKKDAVVLDHPRPQDILEVGDVIKVGVKEVKRDTGDVLWTLEQEPVVDGALIAMEPGTGKILSMVGGYDFKRSEFNRAISAKRQPGSAFKPLIYATAIEQGLTSATVVVDAPVVYTDPALAKVWKPENYEEKFYGPISLREALVYSRNLATVRLVERIGVRKVVDFAGRIGIASPLTPDLSLALGSSGVSLFELTSAFSVFANQGVRAEPYAIVSVEDASGRILERHEPVTHEVMTQETAYVITDMMQDVIQRGTGARAKVLNRPLAGKTGTTNDFTDAWFVGFSPHLAAGVWVGFDDMRSLGEREAGAVASLPIWISFMKEVLPVEPPLSFPVPETMTFARIDPKTGLLVPEGAEQSVVEVFVRGTEPSQYAVEPTRATDFFRLDAEKMGSESNFP